MKSTMLHDFIQVTLQTQVLLDIFLPPPFAAFCWVIGKLRSFFHTSSFEGLSGKDCKYFLVATYILMFGLTIYSRFSR